MQKRVRTARTLIITAGAMLAGMLVSSGNAHAAPNAPVASFPQGGDGYINMFEIGATQVKVDYEAGVAEIRARVVSGSCSSAATPTTEYQTYTVPGGPNTAAGSHTFVFDLSDASNSAAPFPEGDILCAIVRAGVYQNDGSVYNGPYLPSINAPVKDTIVLAGSVSIHDPVSPNWLNLTESLADPAGSPAGSIRGRWLKNPDSDATVAQVWWDRAPTPFAPYPSDCGRFAPGAFPAVTGYSASSAAHGGTTADQSLAKSCVDLFLENEQVSFNAHWTDAAGNLSPVASTQAFPDGNLKVDRVIPATPVVDLLGADVDWQRPLDNTGAPITSVDVINTNNQRNISVSVGYTDTDIAKIQVSVTDGSTTLTQQRNPDNNPQLFPGFDLLSFNDCSSTNNPPTHAPIAPLPAAPPRVADCITASGVLIDLAGNASSSNIDTAFKDATRPAAPSFAWVPSLITDANDQLTEIEVTGEPYTAVYIKLTDEDPSSSHLSNYPITNFPTCSPGQVNCADGLTDFRLDNTGFGAIDADVTTLADGTLTAEVHLVDAYGNDSRFYDQFNVLRGFSSTTATKHLTTPSLVLTSPAENSVNGGTVKFTGVAKYNNVACGGCEITIYDHPSNIPNYGNPANIALVTTTADANGAFEATYKYLSSGSRRTFFRATNLSNASDPINGRPSAVRRFDVDVRVPVAQVVACNSGAGLLGDGNEAIYQASDPVVICGVATDDFAGVAGVELELWKLEPTGPVTGLITGRPIQTWLSTYQYAIQGDQVNCAGCPGGRSVTWNYDFSSLAPGRYTVRARAADRAGNLSQWAQDWNFTKLGY